MIRFSFVEPTYLLTVGLVLLVISVVAGSDLGVQAPMLLVGLVWALHLSVGLAAIRLAVVNLTRWRMTVHWPDLALYIVGRLDRVDGIDAALTGDRSMALESWGRY